MFKNYLSVTLRRLLKQKTFSLINILGLSFGLMFTLLILLWVQDELSVDRYHEKGDQIAQAYLKGTKEENTSFQPTVSPAIASMLLDQYPEVSNVVRLAPLQEVVFKYNDKIFVESSGVVSDPSIFSVFSYQFIKGNPDAALVDPHSIVLTESTSKKYFGYENPIGKMLRMDNAHDFKVTGIIKDLPANAYRKFDFLVPLVFMKELGYDIEGTPFYPCSYLTYVLLKDNVDIENLSNNISSKIYSKGEEISFEICLVPFRDTYFFDTGGRSKSTILILIAVFILGIACINFINLSTARSMIRAKEIGVRKVIGATRFELAKQFLSESIIITLIAAVLAVCMAELGLSYFGQLTGKILTLQLNDPIVLSGIAALVLITGFIAGVYPALYLSGFNPVRIIKNDFNKKARSPYRRALIVFQFALSILFIICTNVISRQIHYVRNFNLGINKSNIVYVRLEGDITNRYDAIKNELLKNSNISSVTSASNLPINVSSGSYFNWGVNDEVGRRICPITVGYDFLETFDIKMAQGRFYSKDFLTDSSGALVVNETAIKKIKLKDPVGNPFYFNDKYYTLIGVVKDYQHNSPLNTQTEPMVFWLTPGGSQYLFARITPSITDIETITATANYIQSVCNRFSTERPISSQFLSEFSFVNERNLEAMNQLIFISTLLMIFIACLGLYGLSSFLSERKTKEIGLRKVLGASISRIVLMLSKEFCLWVLLANLVAWPIAYFMVQKVLEDYAFRVSISIWVFIGAGFSALVVALLAVSWQAIRAAKANPVKSLKYE
ncbi:MAG: ABC transporter permease [Ignavibacteriaceae bacterium]